MTTPIGPQGPAEAEAAPRCLRDADDHVRRLLAPLAPDWALDEGILSDDGVVDADELLDIATANAEQALAALGPVRSPYRAYIRHPSPNGPRVTLLQVTSAKPRTVPITYRDITRALATLVGMVALHQEPITWTGS